MPPTTPVPEGTQHNTESTACMCSDFSTSSAARTFLQKEEVLTNTACYAGSPRAPRHPQFSTKQLKR